MVFFRFISGLQNKISIAEKWIERHKIIYTISVVGIIVCMGLMMSGCNIWPYVSFPFIVLFFCVELIGWRSSAKKWLLVSIVYNFICSYVVTLLIKELFSTTIFAFLFALIYILSWIIMSLLADDDVALLTNEVTAGLSTSLFTIVSYLITVRMGQLPSLGEALLFTSKMTSSEKIEKIWINPYIEVELLYEILQGLIIFLPMIAASAVSIVLLKIKIYGKRDQA